MILLEAPILLVAFIVLFWFSAWGLLEESVDWLEEKGVGNKFQIYGSIFVIVVLYMCCSPRLLIRI